MSKGEKWLQLFLLPATEAEQPGGTGVVLGLASVVGRTTLRPGRLGQTMGRHG